MNVSETMEWYQEKLKEGLSGEEIEKQLDAIEAAAKIEDEKNGV